MKLGAISIAIISSFLLAALAFAEASYPQGKQLCAKCSTASVVMMDGCMTCLTCGDSKCG